MVSGAVRAADMSVAAIGAVDYAKALDGLSLKQAQLMLTTQGIVGEEQKDLLVKQGLIATSDRMSASLVAEALANNGLNKEKQEALLIESGLMNAKTKELITENAVTESKLRAILAENGIKGAKADTLIASILQTGQNTKEAVSWKVLASSIKETTIALLTNPITWVVGAIASIGLLVKGYDALIGRQEKLARTKIEGLTEDISEFDTEINSLEELQNKLESAKGNKAELAKIQAELNDVIGHTPGLLNGESKAWDAANVKIQTNIDLLKQQRKEAQRNKVNASKELFDNNTYEVDWGFDITGDKMRYAMAIYQEYVNAYKEMDEESIKWAKILYGDFENAEDYAFKRLQHEGIQIDDGVTYNVNLNQSDWENYWREQVDVAYDVFEDTIDTYDGVGGQSFLKNLISNMVMSGSDLSQISNAITHVIENEDIQNVINDYWESLVDPNIDSEKALSKVKSIFDGIVAQFPELASFFDNFYNQIATAGSNAVKSAETNVHKITDSSILSSVEALSDGLDQLAEIYKDVKDGKTFDYSSILNNDDFKNAFGKYTEEYEKFISTIANSPDDINACQDAFNKLVTAYIYGQGALSNVTEETEKSIITMLEQMGITNAQEIVNRQLAIRTATLTDAEENLNEIKNQGIDATIDLENAEAKELLVLIDEAKQADLNVDALYGYTMQKIEAQAVALDTSKDIQGLANLCGSLNIATEAIASYTTAKEALQKLEDGYDGRTNPSDYVRTKKALEERINQAQLDMQQAVSEFTSGDYRVDVYVEGKYDGTSSSTKDTKNTFDWIETKLSRIQRTITNLGKTVSATYKQWSTRNNALAQEMSAINQEIATQQQAYDAYMAKANSVGLPEPYKTLVEDGGLRIDEIADEALKEQIQDYQEWYNKAIDCSDAIQDLQDSLAELAKTKFDNISKEYDDRIAMIEHHTSMLEGYINRAETAGFWASEVYYQKMAEKELENINQLQSKYNDLTNTLNESVSNGLIEQYSEAWYEMRIDINDVEQALQQANTQLVEFNQTLQQIRWDIFDRASDYKDLFIEESNFLAELISRRDLYNEVGSLTDEGLAVQGLHAVNYNAYMEQSEAYAKEILKLNEEIANDPNDLELIDRRNELIGLQQEAIQNAMSEKDAIKDLISDGYDTMLDSLNNLIDKRKEALNAERDLFDYQNSIQEKTDTISSYQKQLQAYAGNNSEEAKAIIQKLQVSLAEAEKDLRETEYDKWMSDQESMLDNLYNQTEQWINTRLDDINGLVSEAIQATNDNAATISGAITDVAESFDTTLSEYTKLLWDGINENTSLLLKPYEDVANGIESGTTKLETILGSIDTKLQTMVDDLNAQATVESESIGQPDIEYNETNNYDDDYEYSEPPHPTSSGVTFTGGTFYEDSYKGGNTGNSKNQWTGHEVEVTHESGTGMVHIVDKTTGTILGWVDKDQLRGYATGTTNAKKGFNLVSEKGDEIIKDNDGNIILARGEQIFPFEGGETVFNAAKTAELLNGNLMPLNAERLWGNIVKTPRLPEMMNKGVGGNIANDIQLNIAVKANNFDEFCTSFKTAIKDDPQCRKLLRAVTVDETVGRGGLRRNNF